MKKQLFALSLFCICISIAKAGVEKPTALKPALSFTENKGQVGDQNFKPRPDVLYSGNEGALTFHIKNNGISYQLSKVNSWREEKDPKTRENIKVIEKQTISRIDIDWKSINKNFIIITDEALPGYNNYYFPQCPNGALNVKSYKGITLKNIYNNINLHYYEKQGYLKYDYIVAPHTDYKQIQFEIKGGKLEIQKNGDLLIKTSTGKIVEERPLVFQNGKALNAKYLIHKNIVSFDIENYDPAYELIIDPIARVWGTFYGGWADDKGYSTSTDMSGNVFMAGVTNSSNGTSIATVGSFQSVSTGFNSSFLVKFNSNGVRQWGTYYGNLEETFSCCTDAIGNVFIAGRSGTNSGTLVASAGSHQNTYGGGSTDAFLAKFDGNGVRLWGTYYGGNGGDEGYGCCTDPAGNVFLSGVSGSTIGNVIATPGSHQSISTGGDAFLVKFDGAGVRQWGTYYGPGWGYGCAADPFGNVFLCGHTSLTTGTSIATAGSHQSIISAFTDGFLVKFNGSGVRQWGTYYGGNNVDYAQSCATDALGNVYLAGITGSSGGTVIATIGSQQSNFGGMDDAYLVKFDAAGIRQWGTYYGGSGQDFAYSCTTDSFGNVYISGYTTSNAGSVIATPNSYQTGWGGGTDAYLAVFNSSGVRLHGTYYGPATGDWGNSCSVDGSGNIYLAGYTNSIGGSWIATPGSHQYVYGGNNYDAFLVKFKQCAVLGLSITANSPICAGTSLNFSASATTTIPLNYHWIGPSSYTSSSQNPFISNAQTINGGFYSLTADDGLGCSENVQITVTVNPIPNISVNSGAICIGQSFTMNPVGANTYTISGGNPIVTPTTNTSYTISGTSSQGCASTLIAISNVTVNSLPIVTASSSNSLICSGDPVTLTSGGANSYTWNTNATGSVITVSPTTTTNYTVNGTNINNCKNTATLSVATISLPIVTSTISNPSICLGNSVAITSYGANTYTWSTSNTGSNIVVSPSTTASFTVTGTDLNGCKNISIQIVTVNPLPNLIITTNDTIICSGGTTTLIVTGANTYTWNTNSNGNQILISPTATTNYTVIGTDVNGCENSITITQSVSTCVGIKSNISLILNPILCPNPNSGEFYLELKASSDVVIINSIGQIIYKNKLQSGKHDIRINEYPKGLYFVELSYLDATKQIFKVLKE